ncbi:hypothetical protein [Nocardia flavorosea]|uniref:Uncharacterized protein n=1 Tax=Nocardia flavorosea TaxID=53429 RepID=A0A846YU56_9NOCA|nr:hypothetical protein [Nocardia flavorosea]NKY60519.1 hypothetical protein [Nocardia flavorosea]
METPEPSAAELVESVVRAGADAGYRIDRDTEGRLQITAINNEPVKHSLTFAVTDQELRAYYLRLAANTGKPVAASTPWQTWTLLMSAHLDEAVYEAEVLDRACMITVGETGFQPMPT